MEADQSKAIGSADAVAGNRTIPHGQNGSAAPSRAGRKRSMPIPVGRHSRRGHAHVAPDGTCDGDLRIRRNGLRWTTLPEIAAFSPKRAKYALPPYFPVYPV